MTRLITTLIISFLLFGMSLPVLATPTEVTWYGQSAFRIVTPGGKVLLVDPWIVNPANPNGKQDLEGLQKVDLILITHGHGDHIGNAVEIAKKTGAKLVATFDLMKALVAYAGFPEAQTGRPLTGSFGGQIPLLDGEVTVQFIPAVHGGSMDTPTGPVYAGHPGGFLVSVKNGPRIYHTGDTDLFGDMALLQGQVDLMLVCIGDKFTMGPVRAAQAVEMVRPKMAVPMHFGTTSGQTGTPEQFKTALRKYGLELLMRQMKVGETLTWK
jgi:L-ascorbate metabolism protein UlaG (beta-lactamase superfamily)